MPSQYRWRRGPRRKLIEVNVSIVSTLFSLPYELLNCLIERIFIIDTIHPLISDPSLNLSAFLSSFMSPHTSIVATYHLDVPVHSPITSSYLPSSLTLLKYLATTIFTTHSASQVFARKRSMSKSLAEPVFGLMEATEGVLVGMGSNDPQGVVLEMEHRRRSGRGVEEWFFMSAVTDVASLDDQMQKPIILLDDHPLCCAQPVDDSTTADGFEESTFSLQLTEKQRRDRERVILPYFDAQREGGGVGGRILYDMDAEDDFDEEEDEI